MRSNPLLNPSLISKISNLKLLFNEFPLKTETNHHQPHRIFPIKIILHHSIIPSNPNLHRTMLSTRSPQSNQLPSTHRNPWIESRLPHIRRTHQVLHRPQRGQGRQDCG
ncbi:hypothetical protein Droror1_Dr00006931 [Drosera rotundifolia]